MPIRRNFVPLGGSLAQPQPDYSGTSPYEADQHQEDYAREQAAHSHAQYGSPGTVTTTTRQRIPMGGGMGEQPEVSPFQAWKNDRRQNFLASVQRNLATRNQGIEMRRAEFAQQHGQMPMQAAGAANAPATQPAQPYVDPKVSAEIHKEKIAKIKDRYNLLPAMQKEQPDVLKRTQDELDAAHDERINGLTPTQPQQAAPVAQAPQQQPFQSQLGRMDVSEQMAKTMYDNVRERQPDPNKAAAEFAQVMSKYNVDGTALVKKWMDAPSGENPNGYSVNDRGGELRPVAPSNAKPQPQAPRAVIPMDPANGRGGVYDTPDGRIVVGPTGQRVGAPIGPAAPQQPQAPQAQQYDVGPYQGFDSLAKGPAKGYPGTAQPVQQAMQVAGAKASGSYVGAGEQGSMTATNHQTGERMRWNGSTWEPM